jgi:thioredoxin reductase (NADPH)
VSPYEKPTRLEALRYYRRVVDTSQLAIEFGEHVVSVVRETVPGSLRGAAGGEEGIFAVETRSDKGVRRIRHARNVVFAIGYFDHPNYLGIPGEDLPHVARYYEARLYRAS